MSSIQQVLVTVGMCFVLALRERTYVCYAYHGIICIQTRKLLHSNKRVCLNKSWKIKSIVATVDLIPIILLMIKLRALSETHRNSTRGCLKGLITDFILPRLPFCLRKRLCLKEAHNVRCLLIGLAQSSARVSLRSHGIDWTMMIGVCSWLYSTNSYFYVFLCVWDHNSAMHMGAMHGTM